MVFSRKVPWFFCSDFKIATRPTSRLEAALQKQHLWFLRPTIFPTQCSGDDMGRIPVICLAANVAAAT